MRAFMLAVTGLAFGIAACSSYGTSVVEVNKTQAAVASVSVAVPPSLVAGQTARAIATPKDANGTTLIGRRVAWFTSTASIASVNDSGVISAVAPGTTVVSAVSEGVAGQASMAVMPPPPTPIATVSVTVNPSAILVGQTARATATLQDSSGNPIGGTVTWESSDLSVATVDATGGVKAVGLGNAMIKGSSQGKSASSALSVSAPAPVPVASVSVSPATSSLLVGATVQLSAVTRDANNNVLTGRVVAWSSANAGIALVNSNGLVSAVSAGTTQITASSEGNSSSATISVSAPASVPVASVSVSPATSSLLVGATVQLSAVTRDANNNVLTGRVVAWSSGNAGIASVNPNGLVSAVSAGTTQITASSEGKSGSGTITVTVPAPPPPGGSVEPPGLTVLSDRPFNSTTSTYTAGEDGWWDSGGGGGMTIVADATAPQSPSNVGRMNFPAGFVGGSSPASLERPIKVTTLYVATWVKFSSNWEGHPSSGVNKILHLWIGGLNHLVITAAGTGSGPLTARISLQSITSGGNAEGGVTGIYESTAEFKRGQWHKIEVIALANTAGANGSVKLYLDGVLATSCSGIQFVPGSGVWDLAMWSPTWGGIGDRVTADQYMYMDHIYVSGK